MVVCPLIQGWEKGSRWVCPKCEGSNLVEHSDRLSCGKCGYIEFKNQ
ncbi:MAG: hypothetical protein KAH57_10565 [Thermoplasmata archaeon]|nr:hypothetical protein [Thermoplasmata archaeon]